MKENKTGIKLKFGECDKKNLKEKKMGIEIGIDLGTTNSVVSFVNRKGKLESVKFGNKHIVPSIVFFKTKNDYFIGAKAKNAGLIEPKAVVENFKTRMGDYENKYTIVASESQEKFELSAKQIAKIFLNQLIEKSQKKIQKKLKVTESIEKAVITIPAKFNPTEKEATKWAAEQNNIEVKVAFEPTAAAIAYQKEFNAGEKILVYDFGGGTFDVSLLSAKNGTFREINSNGDKHLGGNLINEQIITNLKERIEDYIELPDTIEDYDEEDFDYDEETLKKNFSIIYQTANKIKEELSSNDSYEDNMMVFDKAGVQQNLDLEFTRKSFNNLIKNQIQRTIDITREVIESSEYDKDDISEIVLAGGSSQIPLVREKLEEYFGKGVKSDADPSTLISIGAAILADGELSGGISTEYKIQNEIGIKANEGSNYAIFDKLISVGQTLPFSITKEYSPVEDYQKTLNIDIFERDINNYPDAKKTMQDGIEHFETFTINNLPKRKQQDLKILVTFKMAIDGTLNIGVELKESSGSLIKSENLKIDKVSNLV